MAKLSDQIRQAVATCGLTQYRLAERLQVSESTLSRFMRGGSIRTELLDHVGELLGLKVTMTLPRATRDLALTVRRRSKAEK